VLRLPWPIRSRAVRPDPAQPEQPFTRCEVLPAHLEDGCPLVSVADENDVRPPAK
jgi:hypothetical protein